jgi:hypothetical protein
MERRQGENVHAVEERGEVLDIARELDTRLDPQTLGVLGERRALGAVTYQEYGRLPTIRTHVRERLQECPDRLDGDQPSHPADDGSEVSILSPTRCRRGDTVRDRDACVVVGTVEALEVARNGNELRAGAPGEPKGNEIPDERLYP